ncbi:MAG TPA: hypothetical protein VG099_11465, partial [Gemmataceae bacterium]|nr:hypothetical protein [Gemmataceae bacterium]
MPYIQAGFILLLLCAQTRAETGQLVFSLKTWEGDYASSDVPGGVQTSPVVSTIYTIQADGTNLRKVVELGKNTDNPTFSPDGKWIYFQSNASGHSRVYRCFPDGSRVENLTRGDHLDKRWQDAFGYVLARDGTRLLYTVHDGSTGHVALADADGRNARLLFPEVGYIYMGALAPTANQIVVSGPARGYRLLIGDLADNEPR